MDKFRTTNLSIAIWFVVLFIQPVLFPLFGQRLSKNSAKTENIVSRVLRSSPIVDGHSDLLAWYFGCTYKKLDKCPREIEDYPLDVVQKGHTDIPRWRKGGVGGVQLNVYADTLADLLTAYDLVSQLETKYSKDLKVVSTSAEMKAAMRSGKIALLPMLEGSDRLENKPAMLRTLYKLGLRCMTLTYVTSDIADGSDDKPRHEGISQLGREMVREMNRLGIIVDISHSSASSMSDVLDVTTAPVIFSHSNARAVCDINRNVSDEILQRLKKNGGLIMIDMAPEHTSKRFARWMSEGDDLWTATKTKFPDDKGKLAAVMGEWERANPQPEVTVGEVADHFDHVKRLIGVDHIGISGDYDGIEYTTVGLEDVSGFPNLLRELVRRGWTEKELKKITSENYLRVFANVEKVARNHSRT